MGPTGCIFARKEVPPCYAKKIIPPDDSWAPAHLVADLCAYLADVYTGLCQLNQQVILGAGPLDVNPIAMLLLQPLFLLLSPVGGSAAAHPNQSSFPLLSICDSTALSSPSPCCSSLGALGTVWSTWSTTESHRKMNVRERLTVGMRHVHGRMHATASFLP